MVIIEGSTVWFRFYEELNDFLIPSRRKTETAFCFQGVRSVKDAVESLGVPHTEVDLILINGVSVGFEAKLHHGDRVAVYPVFESLDIVSQQHLRPEPLRELRFVVNGDLGKLARGIRMLGFDAILCSGDDVTLIRISNEEKRILLTRSRSVLKHKNISRGIWIRSADKVQQLREVIVRLDIRHCLPFSRCMDCNSIVLEVSFEEVQEHVPEGLRLQEFARCENCGKVYWKGSHYDRMGFLVKELLRGNK